MSEVINNREHRIEAMRSIIEQLHEGADPASVREELAEIVRQTDGAEIAAMEQQLIERGMPPERIRSLCDLHADVLRDITDNPPPRQVEHGHPLDTFRLENFAIGNAAGKLRKRAAALAEAHGDASAAALEEVRESANALMDVDKHYARKENLLFPYLEKRGVTGPSQVMWAKDDEARELLKALQEALDAGETGKVVEAAEAAAEALDGMIYKENNILFPMAEQFLTDEEWGKIFEDSPDIGWCIVPPRSGYQPPKPAEPLREAELPPDRSIRLPTGALTREQLVAITGVLPVDLTFIDADDRVAWFSHGPDRVFARNASIIGRKVQHCHPPKSVDVVNRILDDFKSGRRSEAEFWIEFHGRFVHIRYFAARDESEEYVGALEVTQDVTRIRALEGERRLLQYDD